MKLKQMILTLMLAIAIVIAIWYGFTPFFTNKNTIPAELAPNLAVGTALHPSKPLVDFSLTDTNGKLFNQASLFGHWTLMFFGYSKCPNICPATLAILSEVWRSGFENPQKKEPVHFIFVSLDPKMDTIQTLRTFVTGFHPSFAGLTGDISEVQKLSKVCSIYSLEDPTSKTANGEKIIDHSATLLLINPQGRIQALFSPPHNAAAIAQDLNALVH